MVENYEYIIYLKDNMSGTLRKVSALSSQQYGKMAKDQERLNASTNNLGNTFKRVFGAYIGIQGVSAFAKLGTELKQTKVQMDVLSGSAETGQKLYKELTQYANITSYSNKQVNEAATTMLLFGVSQEKILPVTKMLGDVAGGNSERLSKLALAFGNTTQAGKLMGQDLLQYINAGFSPLEEISKKTGKSGLELRKMMENGQISLKMVEDAFMSATGEGGRFYGMMDKMSQEAFGIWSNISGQSTQGLAELSAKLADATRPFLKQLEITSSKFLQWAQNVNINADRVSKWINIIWKATKTFVIFKTATMAATLWMRFIVPAFKMAQFAIFSMRFQMKFATAETFAFSNMVRFAKVQWIGLSAAMKANAIGLAITGLTLLITKIISATQKTKDAEEAQKGYNSELENTFEIANKLKMEEFLKQSGFFKEVFLGSVGGMKMYTNELQKSSSELEHYIKSAKNLDELRNIQEIFNNELINTQRNLNNINDLAKGNGGDLFQQTLSPEFQNKIESYSNILKTIGAEINKYGGSVATGGVNFSNQTQTTDNIISGGSKPTNITINLQKLNEKIEISTTNLTEGITDIEGKFVEMFLRVLNSSQKLAVQ